MIKKEQWICCIRVLYLYFVVTVLVLIFTDRRWTREFRWNVLGNVCPEDSQASRCCPLFLSVIVTYKYTSIVMGRK